MGKYRGKLLFVILTCLIMAGCETPGDKFQRFELKESLLGEVRNHVISQAFFLNEHVGFVAISKDTILKTKDGCKSFHLVLSDTSCTFNSIRFLNDTLGFVADKNKYLFRTTDGGKHWDRFTLEIPGAGIQDVHGVSRDTILVALGGDPQAMNGYILRTTDGGANWDTVVTRNVSKFLFTDAKTGYLSGYDGILRTVDSGMTWDTLSESPAMDLVFMTGNEGYMSFSRSLFSTNDGGKNWKLVHTINNPKWIMGQDFSKIECLNRLGTGELVFTLNSRIIRVDAAGKWSQYEFTRPYYQLQMIGPEKGIVYGFEKIILVNF